MPKTDVRITKRPAHEVLLDLIEDRLKQRRSSPRHSSDIQLAVYLLGQMHIPGDKLSGVIKRLNPLVTRSPVAGAELRRLTAQLQREYDDYVR